MLGINNSFKILFYYSNIKCAHAVFQFTEEETEEQSNPELMSELLFDEMCTEMQAKGVQVISQTQNDYILLECHRKGTDESFLTTSIINNMPPQAQHPTALDNDTQYDEFSNDIDLSDSETINFTITNFINSEQSGSTQVEIETPSFQQSNSYPDNCRLADYSGEYYSQVDCERANRCHSISKSANSSLYHTCFGNPCRLCIHQNNCQQASFESTYNNQVDFEQYNLYPIDHRPTSYFSVNSAYDNTTYLTPSPANYSSAYSYRDESQHEYIDKRDLNQVFHDLAHNSQVNFHQRYPFTLALNSSGSDQNESSVCNPNLFNSRTECQTVRPYFDPYKCFNAVNNLTYSDTNVSQMRVMADENFDFLKSKNTEMHDSFFHSRDLQNDFFYRRLGKIPDVLFEEDLFPQYSMHKKYAIKQ